jgi:hypothetical protein
MKNAGLIQFITGASDDDVHTKGLQVSRGSHAPPYFILDGILERNIQVLPPLFSECIHVSYISFF